MFDPSRPVYLVGGGPSLAGFDFGRLAGRQHLAINRAHEHCPQAQVLFWTDAKFWLAEGDEIAARRRQVLLELHAARLKIAARDDCYGVAYPEWVEVWDHTGLEGLDTAPRCFRHGNNSGYGAINIAWHLCGRLLVLLGYDMQLGPDGRDHYHDGYRDRLRPRTLAVMMRPYFSTLVEPLRRLGVTVFNANPDSALDCWPKITIDEALALDRRPA